jgi:hypothetical protein
MGEMVYRAAARSFDISPDGQRFLMIKQPAAAHAPGNK